MNTKQYILNGQIYKHYDEAGLVETPEYDFKGNLLTNKPVVYSFIGYYI